MGSLILKNEGDATHHGFDFADFHYESVSVKCSVHVDIVHEPLDSSPLHDTGGVIIF